MAIHITRGNMLYGSGSPVVNNLSAEYYGQLYIDIATNPRTVYIATAENNESWEKISLGSHKHTVSDFSDLQSTIVGIVQNQGIEAALTSMKGGNNTWDGDWNVFSGTVRVGGKDVLTKGSSIGDLMDVDVSTGLSANMLLGWNGSSFVPFKVEGASPSTGGIDFNQYIRKDMLVSDLNSNASDRALSASAGKAILDTAKTLYAPKDHTHTGFAPTTHTHAQYLEKGKAQTMGGQLNLSVGTADEPLILQNNYSRLSFKLANANRPTAIVGFSGSAGRMLEEVVLGDIDGGVSGRLSLNFQDVHLPSGNLSIGSNQKYMSLPPIKIGRPDLEYVGNLQRHQALDINGGAIMGLNQMVFKNVSNSNKNAILFPKVYAGNSQSTELGYYHYLRLSDNQLITDTALASEQNYISLGGVKIFFSKTDPGKQASSGDIWIKI